jgi:hypothetical protein
MTARGSEPLTAVAPLLPLQLARDRGIAASASAPFQPPVDIVRDLSRELVPIAEAAELHRERGHSETAAAPSTPLLIGMRAARQLALAPGSPSDTAGPCTTPSAPPLPLLPPPPVTQEPRTATAFSDGAQLESDAFSPAATVSSTGSSGRRAALPESSSAANLVAPVGRAGTVSSSTLALVACSLPLQTPAKAILAAPSAPDSGQGSATRSPDAVTRYALAQAAKSRDARVLGCAVGAPRGAPCGRPAKRATPRKCVACWPTRPSRTSAAS